MSDHRKPFSPVDANKKSSRAVSVANRKTVQWSSNRSLASARTAESFADDSEFDFLSKEKSHATKSAQLSHFEDKRWNSRSKTPRTSNLWSSTASVSNEPTTTLAPAHASKAYHPTKRHKDPLKKKKPKSDVSTKVRFLSRNLNDTEHRSIADQSNKAERLSSRLPPLPKAKHRRRSVPKKLATDDSTSILQRGVALETIAEDSAAEERISPNEAASITSTPSTIVGSDTPLICLAATGKVLVKDKEHVSQPSARVDLGSASPSLDHPQTPVFATQPSPEHSSYTKENAETDKVLQDKHESSDMDESPGGDLLELTLSPPPTSENRNQPIALSSTTHSTLVEEQAQIFGPTMSNGGENSLPIETWSHRDVILTGDPNKQKEHSLPECIVSPLNAKIADPLHEHSYSPVDTDRPPPGVPDLDTEREMKVPTTGPVYMQDRKMQQQKPIDKEVWLAMTAPPAKNAFPIGILVPTPGCSSGGDASVDGSELTPDTSLYVHRMNVCTRARPKYALPNKVGRNLWDTFKDIQSEQSAKIKPSGNPVIHGDTKRQEQTRGIETGLNGLDKEKKRMETSSVLSITKPLLDIQLSSFSSHNDKTLPRSTTPSLWTTEHAGNQYKELGVNLAPIFRLNGQCFQHPPLPPGWTISISRSKNIPFYNHPTFGSTFYSPVPLPSNDGNILGATIFLQNETPMEALGMRVRDRILDTCVTPADQKASDHDMINETVVPLLSHRKVLMTPELFSGISSLVRDVAHGDPITVLRQKTNFKQSTLTMAWGSTDHRIPSYGLMTPISRANADNGITTSFRPSPESSQDSRIRNDQTSRRAQSDTNPSSHLSLKSAKEWDCRSRQSSREEQISLSRNERRETDDLLPDRTPDCHSPGLPSSASRFYRVATGAETSTHKERSRFRVPTDIIVVNKPSIVTSTDKFTIDLDATVHMSRKTRTAGHGAVMAPLSGPWASELHSSSDNSSGNLSIESKMLESSSAQTPAALDSYSLQEPCTKLIVGSAHTGTSFSSKCGQVDPFSTPGDATELGTAKQKQYNTPYIARRSTEVENKRSLSGRESVHGTAISLNIFSPRDVSDFTDLRGDDDDLMEENQLSPTIPTRVIVACGGDDDSMSHMHTTPAFRPEPGKISTRYKPTAILPETFEKSVASFEDPMEDRTIRSYGSMNSHSCNSSLSRASHRAMNPTLPLCALRKVPPSEDEESIIAAYIRKRKRQLESKSKPTGKKKARKTKHVSPDDNSAQ